MNASCIKNIQVADTGIKILSPNGKCLTSTHTVELNCSKLTKETRITQMFPILSSTLLISLGQLSDSGCTLYLDARTMTVRYNENIVLVGKRVQGGLWTISYSSDEKLNQLICTDSVHHIVNILCFDTTVQHRFVFLHTVMVYPVTSTFCKGLDDILVLPGNLTTKQLQKHLNFLKIVFKDT